MVGKLLKVRLHVLSPIHIGCDDVYEPTGFVIDKDRKALIEFDSLDFIKSLSPAEKQEITNISMEGNAKSILKIYDFVFKKLNKIKTGNIGNIEVEVSNGVVEHYGKILKLLLKDIKKDIENEINRFTINRTAYNPNGGLAYIPGSSLKGSLRTGYLNSLIKTDDKKLEKLKEFAKVKDGSKKVEEELLGGSFDSDPFSMIKVSDFIPIGDKTATKIIYAVNKKKKISQYEAKGPYQILETIKERNTFEGTININDPKDHSEIKNPMFPEKWTIFFKGITDFYFKEFKIENENIIKKINASEQSYEIYETLYKGKIKYGCFVRLGRHSGAEAVTIEGIRDIKIMQQKGQPPKQLDHATTIWLASDDSKPQTNSGLVPFGWAILEIFNTP